MEKLQHDGLLDSTNIKSFEKCVSCTYGKMARKPYSHQVERAKGLLGLIHTDVCGPFKIMSRQGASYFITFTDDFSQFDKWLNAMNVEMQSMRDNEVWELVNLPPNGKTIGHKWLFKKKTDMDGAIHTYRARLLLKVSCYTDTGYLTDADDMKSQTRYVFVLNGEAVWICKFIFGLGVVPTIKEPINIYCDNTGAIAIAKNHGVTKGARHFHAKDSGCSKHMIGDRSQLVNFVQKFLGTVKFGNDHVAKIMGYRDYQIGNVTISQVYYVEGLGHNLFSVGQFCDSDLEVAFRQHTCFIRNLDGVDLLTGKSTKKTHKPKSEDTNQEKLYLLHMDLCGPMRIESVNGKKYILVIVDDYSQFTWVKFLRSKDETSNFIIKFLKMIQNSSGPALNEMTPGTISSGLVQASSPSTSYVPPSRNDWDLLFQPMFDELLNPPTSVVNQAPEVIAPIAEVIPPVHADSTGSLSSTTVKLDELGGILKNKARLVARGYRQEERIDFEESFSPKYSFESCDPVDTPMVEKSKLDKDREGKAVDLSHYRGMIDTLFYLTASRLDLQFAICMCARYQARPTEKHVHAVKRIFRYLRGTVHWGPWYPKDSSVALTAFADANHAGCQDTHRSTSG
nr:uncharacterized mitochondrial protein AtMg00810-like [Tanacetum cinerariifolium]